MMVYINPDLTLLQICMRLNDVSGFVAIDCPLFGLSLQDWIVSGCMQVPTSITSPYQHPLWSFEVGEDEVWWTALKDFEVRSGPRYSRDDATGSGPWPGWVWFGHWERKPLVSRCFKAKSDNPMNRAYSITVVGIPDHFTLVPMLTPF